MADYRATSRVFAGSTSSPGPEAGTDTVFVDSIAWDDVLLGDRCRVSHYIVTDGVRVAAGSEYSNMVLLRGADGETVAVPITTETR